jgi:hypothetical protein
MEKRGSEFSRNSVSRTAAATLAQRFSRISALAIGIARLDHEIADHAMEKQTVKITRLCQAQEIVPVLWGGIGQPDNDDTPGSADLDVPL